MNAGGGEGGNAGSERTNDAGCAGFDAGGNESGAGVGGTSGEAGEDGHGGHGDHGGEGGAPADESGSEVIVNGDFERGFFAVKSQYRRVKAPAQMTAVGECTVANDPSIVRVNVIDWAAFGDHTSGNGAMLICDGATAPGRQVWLQTVHVKPNTSYRFSFWFSNVQPGDSMPTLQAFMGTSSLAEPLAADPEPGIWIEYSGIWRSGSDDAVTISIVDTNTSSDWNDFALDDVALARSCDDDCSSE